MDSVKSNGISSWNSAFCSYVAMFLLLSFASFISVSEGSRGMRYFQLEGRGMLDVLPRTPPPAMPPTSLAPLPASVAPDSSRDAPASAPSADDGIPPVLPPSLSPSESRPLLPPTTPPSSMFPPSSIFAPPFIWESPPAPNFPALNEPPPAGVNPGDTWNSSEKAGVVIAALAALLQVAVVAFLLIKRHQMMNTAEYEDLDDFDGSDPNYRHHESV